jgi:hypothetical protein
MEAFKSEVLISQLVVETGTKFQRLHPYFWFQQLIKSNLNAVQQKPVVENPRWWLVGWLS